MRSNHQGGNARAAGILIALAFAAVSSAPPAAAASRYDPDWPCQQIRVPEMSPAAVWSGPPIEGLAGAWMTDPEAAEIAAKLAARRTPLEEAQTLIDAFADRAGSERKARLTLVFAGVFDGLSRQRDEVMAGLTRIAHRQSTFAGGIRAENHDFLDLRDKPDADPATLKQMSDKLDWDLRIYDDRRKSISYACEVPTLIEQRVFAIARMIQAKFD
jgi:hypothetical protein